MSKSNFLHTLLESKSIFQLNKRLFLHALSKMLRFYWDTRYLILMSEKFQQVRTKILLVTDSSQKGSSLVKILTCLIYTAW